MKCCHHLQVTVSMKQEETHMQGPCSSEEAIRKVLLVPRVEGAGGRKEGTEEVSSGQISVQDMHLGACCPAGSEDLWELMKAYFQKGCTEAG